jgi:uncharacterized membrane protein YedE/YeeE
MEGNAMLTEFAAFEDVDLAAALPWAGIVLGLLFGIVAQASRFCLRSAVVGTTRDALSPMAGAYALALLAAIIGAQGLQYLGFLDFSETRFVGDSLPLGALILGGSMFGVGMVLTRGCASRLTILSAQGNMRAMLVIAVFAITAYATLRGVLAGARVGFTDATAVTLDGSSVLPVAGAAALVALLALAIWRSRVSLGLALAGVAVGLLVVSGWFATGVLLLDEFDPREAQSLAFTAGASEGLFYTMASTALEPGFAGGIMGGALLGAFTSALFRRELRLESFETPEQTVRYLAGAVLMGIGGVLAGGCTVGAGLTGLSTLALGPLVALVAIITGAASAHAALSRDGVAGVVPAE